MMNNEERLRKENKILKQKIKVDKAIGTNSKKEPVLSANSGIIDRGFGSGIFKTHNDTRDLYKVFGYTDEIKLEHYLSRYERQDIAKRIVDSYPKACWSFVPRITDDLDTQDESSFEEEINTLFKDRRLKILQKIRRLDIITGLGRYGVLYIGVADGLAPSEEVGSVNGMDDILFLAPYSEDNVCITTFEEDPQNARYGLPTMYKITTGNENGKKGSMEVHHTRILHVVEGALENDVYGTPRLKPVFNRLMDLEKIVGGSAETFFLNARGGLHMNQEVGTQMSDATLLESRLEEFSNNLTRYLRTKGIDVTPLNFDTADPKNHFDILIALLSAATGIPKRILTGSEQGQLASSQDENNWISRVNERQRDYCEFDILRPLLDWFVTYGVVSAPQNDEYDIVWKDLRTVSDMDKADVAVKMAQALATYTNALGVDLVMPPEQFFEEVLQLEYRPDDLPDADDRDDLSGEEE